LGSSKPPQIPISPNFVIFPNFHFPKPPKTSMKRPKKMMGNCNISNIPKTSMKRPRKVIVKMVIFGMFCHLLVALFFLKNDHFWGVLRPFWRFLTDFSRSLPEKVCLLDFCEKWQSLAKPLSRLV